MEKDHRVKAPERDADWAAVAETPMPRDVDREEGRAADREAAVAADREGAVAADREAAVAADRDVDRPEYQQRTALRKC
jgi:hypothetical protein